MFSNDLICNILEYIEDNINNKISIEDIVSKFFYNRFYIMKLFKREIGVSINTYINYLRIYNSTKLIKSNNYSVRLVGILCGFFSIEYFSETFKKVIGVSPLKYKKYCFNRFTLSEKEVYLILGNLIELQMLMEYTDRYKKNRKPKVAPVRKLSIFK